ncbi:MAG: prenyltransferase, partial [Candidatus Odinarchaeota archaeon]|nr:prenyltransferase [Candidatus Odinarchaeota archaeon]
LALIILGFISGFFYTAPPFKWAHHGVGEVFVGLNFGLFMILGAYYVQALTIDTEPIIASLPITLLIAAVLYVNEFPDYKADMATGKRTLIVRLGRQTAAKLYPVFILTPYIIVLLSVILGIMPVISLIVFATIKKALVAINVAKQHYDEPMKLIPANVNTIKCHLHFGILLVVSYLITGILLYLYPISLFPLYLSSLF